MSDASYILQRKGFISMDTHKIAPQNLGGDCPKTKMNVHRN